MSSIFFRRLCWLRGQAISSAHCSIILLKACLWPAKCAHVNTFGWQMPSRVRIAFANLGGITIVLFLYRAFSSQVFCAISFIMQFYTMFQVFCIPGIICPTFTLYYIHIIFIFPFKFSHLFRLKLIEIGENVFPNNFTLY